MPTKEKGGAMSPVRPRRAGWVVGEEDVERASLGASVTETLSLHGAGCGSA